MAKPTWNEREYVLLEAIAAAEEQGSEPVSSATLAAATGLGSHELALGLRRLHDNGYIVGQDATTFGEEYDLMMIRLQGSGLRAVGQWPPEDQYDAFLAVLDQRIEAASSDEERGRLERVRETALGVGRDVLTSVLSAWARGQVGL